MTTSSTIPSVRQARFELALALQTNPQACDEALEQLDRAITEPGEAPPTWDLHLHAAHILQDVDPAAAVSRFVRSLRHGAPDEVAETARQWVESLRFGTLTTSSRMADLGGPDRSAPVRLFYASLLRAQGDSHAAFEVAGAVDPPDDVTRRALLLLRVRSLIDLRELDEARRLLDEDVDPNDADVTVLRARVHFAGREFDETLAQLAAVPSPLADEAEALRNLCLVGLERSDEVVSWERASNSDNAGPETWLSRAVAALDLRGRRGASGERDGYAAAREAATWAERWNPTSLSTMLVYAQAQLENDELEPGLAALDALVSRVRERGRDPYWLEQQRIVRTDGRFQYFECEYGHALHGNVPLAQLTSVSKVHTTYAQDGRLAVLRADVHGEGSEWAEALDDALRAYRTAEHHETAADVGRRLLAVAPTLMRAVNTAWAVYNATYPGDNARGAVAADPVTALQDLTAAVEQQLRSATHDEVLSGVEVLAPLWSRQVELADRLDDGLEAAAWTFAAAIVNSDWASTQFALDWIVRTVFDFPAAPFDIVRHASALDPAASPELRLIARTNWVGSDEECRRLLAEVVAASRGADESMAVTDEAWQRAVALRLALLSGNLTEVSGLMTGDLGGFGWALEMQALAAIAVDGFERARPFIEQLRERVADDNASILSRAWISGILGADEAEIDDLLGQAARGGAIQSESIESSSLTLRFAAHPYRPLIDHICDEVASARCPAELQYLEHAERPWLEHVAGALDDEQRIQFATLLARRRSDLEEELDRWPERLAKRDDLVGAFAALWKGVTRRDPVATAAAADRLAGAESQGSIRLVIPHVLQRVRERLADDVLSAVVQDVAAGLPARQNLVALLGDEAGPAAAVARAMSGCDDAPALEGEDHRRVLLDAIRRSGLEGDGFWRVYDVVTSIAFSRLPSVVDDLLDQLAARLGLHESSAVGARSHLAFVLGDGFVPDDTGPEWELFAEYIPALRLRIEDETGYRMPGFNVRGNRLSQPADVVHLLLHEVVHASLQLPLGGVVAFVPDASGDIVDPLTGRPVVHVPSGEPPRDATETWPPLQFVMRHVERFVRDHLPEIVTVWDVAQEPERAAPRDAAEFVERLAALRQRVSGRPGAEAVAR